MKKRRVVPIRHEATALVRDESGQLAYDKAIPLPSASHNPNLSYQEQDENGRVRTFFEQHPEGSRRQRRYRQQHHPIFTKSTHKGREWWRILNNVSKSD